MEESIVRDILQRLARVEEAVENHLPSRIDRVEGAVKAVDTKMWGVLVALAIALLGIFLK